MMANEQIALCVFVWNASNDVVLKTIVNGKANIGT